MKKIITVSALVLSGAIALVASEARPANPVIEQKDRERAAALVEQMTLEEKCLLIAGQVDGFHTAAIERLGIPAVRMADGPQGVRNKTNSTYYPCGIALAASWNRDVAGLVGAGIGTDAAERGVSIMLCPGVNIYRSPLCGRNFEYFGEDPYLASETAVSYIGGIQSKGIVATIKHFAANNQEYQRHQVNSIVDERTLNELYFPTFRKAVEKAHVGAVMTSYNPLNSVHAAENDWLIKDNLRAWGHEGIVMSDWTSTYTTYGCLTSGLDLEMPRKYELTYEEISYYIENGLVSIKEIDDKCAHILQVLSVYGFLDAPLKDVGDWAPIAVNEESRAAAYKASLESVVMLKNEGGVLPVRKGKIVVMGPNADYIAYGGGSGRMQPIEGTTTTLYQGLSALGGKYSVKLLADVSADEAAVAAADAVIVAVGFNKDTEKENADRTYELPEGQEQMILDAAKLNKNVIVVVYSGGEVATASWLGKVKGLLMAWYSGQEGGKALAAIISGSESPSGRLPFTFWGSLEANPSTPYYNPTPARKKSPDPHAYYNTEYKEGLFLGYRAAGKPLFPFGYGLTYGKFEYSNLEVKPVLDGYDVTFTVANKGKAAAAEVAQVYVAPVSPSVVRPAHELKGYAKTYVEKGKKATVTVHLDADAFKHYDVNTHCWRADDGAYRIEVGSSAEAIELSTEITLSKIAIVAHRGFWDCDHAQQSQNSLASLSRAQEVKLWGSECDIHLTSDGKIIVNHDPKINGLVINKTPFKTLAAQLLNNGETRPSFDEYLKQAKKASDRTMLIVELKKQSTKEIEDELVDKTLEAIKARGLYDPAKVGFISFSMNICEKIAAEAPEFLNQYLNGDLSPAKVAEKGINGIDYQQMVLFLHPNWVKEAHDLGMSVNIWTVNDEKDMQHAIDLGVDAITTNNPLLLRKLLQTREK